MIMLLHFPLPASVAMITAQCFFVGLKKKKKKKQPLKLSHFLFCFDVLVWKCFLVFWSNVYGSYYLSIYTLGFYQIKLYLIRLVLKSRSNTGITSELLLKIIKHL